jgi:uncharacterized protein (TIGR02001 family)
MKKILLILGLGLSFILHAQERKLNVSADLVSRYVFRGIDYGNAPAVQPAIEFTSGRFSIGAWGSYALSNTASSTESFQEADIYASYNFDFGLSVGVTDYYYPGSPWLEVDDNVSSHALELNLGYELKQWSFAANYGLNNSASGAGLEDGVMYFELGYSNKGLSAFIGGGDGWHVNSSEKSDFQVVNIGIGATKDIKLSDQFALPVFGQVILNPNSEQFMIVMGFSL